MFHLLMLFAVPSLASPAAVPLREGPHALVVDVGTRSKVPVAGTTEVTTRSLIKVQVRRTDMGWEQSQELCSARVLSETRARTVLPDAFIEAIAPQSYPLTVRHEDGAWIWRADPGPSPIGYDPAVSEGRIPSDKDDPGVIDHEGDGHPGATVHLEVPVLGKVRLYIAQNAWSRYRGQVASSGIITGQVEQVSTEQNTLGASAPMFAADPEVFPVPERSRFRQEPLADDRSCAQLVAAWAGDFAVP